MSASGFFLLKVSKMVDLRKPNPYPRYCTTRATGAKIAAPGFFDFSPAPIATSIR